MSTKLLKVFGGLVGEYKHGGWSLSKGSVAFWTLLAHCIWGWQHGAVVPDMEVYSMWGMIGYSGYKLVTATKGGQTATTSTTVEKA